MYTYSLYICCYCCCSLTSTLIKYSFFPFLLHCRYNYMCVCKCCLCVKKFSMESFHNKNTVSCLVRFGSICFCFKFCFNRQAISNELKVYVSFYKFLLIIIFCFFFYFVLCYKFWRRKNLYYYFKYYYCCWFFFL